MEEEKLSIRVNVADRFYPLKIDLKDEEVIRKAAKLINEKLLLYKKKYSDKDMQDFLAMAALQFVIKMIEMEEKSDEAPVLSHIKQLDTELDEYIKKEVIR